MTRPELQRRMLTAKFADFLRGVKMARDGFSGHGIVNNSVLTLKQANAAHDWVQRYGRILPDEAEWIEQARKLKAGELAPETVLHQDQQGTLRYSPTPYAIYATADGRLVDGAEYVRSTIVDIIRSNIEGAS